MRGTIRYYCILQAGLSLQPACNAQAGRQASSQVVYTPQQLVGGRSVVAPTNIASKLLLLNLNLSCNSARNNLLRESYRKTKLVLVDGSYSVVDTDLSFLLRVLHPYEGCSGYSSQ